MTVIEVDRRGRPAGKDTALRDWVRALEATAPIAANPQRLLARRHRGTGAKRGDAPALLSAAAKA